MRHSAERRRGVHRERTVRHRRHERLQRWLLLRGRDVHCGVHVMCFWNGYVHTGQQQLRPRHVRCGLGQLLQLLGPMRRTARRRLRVHRQRAVRQWLQQWLLLLFVYVHWRLHVMCVGDWRLRVGDRCLRPGHVRFRLRQLLQLRRLVRASSRRRQRVHVERRMQQWLV
jgi:hypothetical protein